MLKPIRQAPCSPALAACQRLMQAFALWLCEPDVRPADVTEANCRARMPTIVEGEWLWDLIQSERAGRPLRERVNCIADLGGAEKQALAAWVRAVAEVAQHYSATPPPRVPTSPPVGKAPWEAFKALMASFYDKGLRQVGLPYLSNGTPVGEAAQRLRYHQFCGEFRQAHRLTDNPDSRDVCVLCGGPLIQPAVDHWIRKAAFPLLAVCDHNLLPVCDECNSPSNKGTKDVHSLGSFVAWFHPYLRPGNNSLRLSYSVSSWSVTCAADTPADQPKVDNLNRLLNLSKRWTKEFKAEYAKQQSVLIGRERKRMRDGQARQTREEVLAFLTETQADLLASEPHYEVHRILCCAMLESARMEAWRKELQLIS